MERTVWFMKQELGNIVTDSKHEWGSGLNWLVPFLLPVDKIETSYRSDSCYINHYY